jgi:hypothetical protein
MANMLASHIMYLELGQLVPRIMNHKPFEPVPGTGSKLSTRIRQHNLSATNSKHTHSHAPTATAGTSCLRSTARTASQARCAARPSSQDGPSTTSSSAWPHPLRPGPPHFFAFFAAGRPAGSALSARFFLPSAGAEPSRSPGAPAGGVVAAEYSARTGAGGCAGQQYYGSATGEHVQGSWKPRSARVGMAGQTATKARSGSRHQDLRECPPPAAFFALALLAPPGSPLSSSNSFSMRRMSVSHLGREEEETQGRVSMSACVCVCSTTAAPQ